MTNLDSVLQSRDIVDKGQSYYFSNSHVWMWELDHKEGWVPKDWCFQLVVLEKTLESPLNSKEMKPVNPKGNQPWKFIGQTDADAEAEAPILWLCNAKSQLIGKDPDAEKRKRKKKVRAGGEGGNRGWDVQMTSLTQWKWVWKSSGSLWRTGKPAML